MRRLVLASLVLATLGAFLYRVYEVWPFTIDDSFISFRYAQNLAAGHGLRFSEHADPVEGFTSPTWVALGALFLVCRLDIVLMAKLTGVMASLGTSVLLWRAFRAWFPEWRTHPLCLLAPALFLWHPDTPVHAVSGMETALHTLLVIATGLSFVEMADDPSPQKAKSFALIGLCLGLTRPDGNLLVVASAVALGIFNLRQAAGTWLVPLLRWYVLPGALYFAVRAWYFGHWLPAPFHVKVLLDDLPGAPGPLAVWSFFSAQLAVLGLVLFALPRLRGARAAFSFAAALFAAFYLIPRHVMGYNHRFLFPILPVLLLLAARGLENARHTLGRFRLPKRVALAVTALPVAWYLVDVTSAWPPVRKARLAHHAVLARAHQRLAERLRAIDPSGDSIVAVQDAGVIPFVSGWNAIDLCGLNDETIAFSGLDIDELALRQVDVVVLNSRRKDQHVHWDWDHALYEKYLTHGFERVSVVRVRKNYFLFVLARPGTLPHRRLSQPDGAQPDSALP